jgi:hypothetical protein
MTRGLVKQVGEFVIRGHNPNDIRRDHNVIAWVIGWFGR